MPESLTPVRVAHSPSPPNKEEAQAKPELGFAQELEHKIHEEYAKHMTPPKNAPRVPDRSQVRPEVLKSAQQMESMFINQMLDVMRNTVQKSDLSLENKATKIYRKMMDSDIAETASRTGGVGLADQIIAYLHSAGYNVYKDDSNASGHLNPEARNESSRTGGTNAGRSIDRD